MIDWKGDEMIDSTRTALQRLFLVCLPLVVIPFTDISQMNAWAGPLPLPKSTTAAGDAERGRAVFNGKGVCSYCHGIDGNKDQPPRLTADTTALIAQLRPQPTDLRNPTVLHLKTDKQRARAIREGHQGTGMFPDTRMTDQEIAHTLAYLASLRRGAQKGLTP